jgi:hypothetical protein
MRLPIDTVAVRFVTAVPAEPVLDYETRAAKADENGQPLFSSRGFRKLPTLDHRNSPIECRVNAERNSPV